MLDNQARAAADAAMANDQNPDFGQKRGGNPHLLPFAASGLFVAAIALFGLASASWLPATGLPLLFLVSVLASAVTFGFWPGIGAAALAFATYNFLFVEPFYTLRVASAADVLALSLFLLTAGLTGWLAGKARDDADAATRRAAQLSELSRFTGVLANCTAEQDVHEALVRHAGEVTGEPVAVLCEHNGAFSNVTGNLQKVALDDDSLQACERAFRNGKAQPATAPGWQGSRFGFYPLVIDGRPVTVAAVRFPDVERKRAQEIEQTITTMVTQAAAALERIAQTAAMEAARIRADQESMRSGLLLSLSHDLRTPLATILGSVSSLREPGLKLNAAARADLLLATEEETRRLSRYVEDLLTMTRLNSGLEGNITDADGRDIVLNALTRAKAAYPSTAFSFADDVKPLRLRTDPALLGQALFNLLDNAAKFSGPGKAVTITMASRDGIVSLTVCDQGPGIASGDAERIFDPLFRGSDTGKSGAGLGLAIVKAIARLLGGGVTADRQTGAEGGSRFVLSVPINPETSA